MLRARNAVGVSVDSNSKLETPARRPDPPVIRQLIPGDKSITVDFDNPSYEGPISDGGSPVIGYRYRVDDEPYVFVNTTASPITITGLTNGTTYTVKLRAVNEMGTSEDSQPENFRTQGNIIESYVGTANTGAIREGLVNGINPNNQSRSSTTGDPIIPSGAPDAPTITKLVPGDKQITVYFNPPSDNGSPITNYIYKLNGGSSASSGTTISPIFIKNLINGTSYNIQICAKNGNPGENFSSSMTAVPYRQNKTDTPIPDTVFGYSPGDYFYTDVNYCSKTCATNKYCQVNPDGTFGIIAENTYSLHQPVDSSNACTANELYGKTLNDIQSQLHVTSQTYKRAVSDYNREWLTTVNYIVGIGVLFGYIYINNLLLPA
jgi:hypothetical protein